MNQVSSDLDQVLAAHGLDAVDFDMLRSGDKLGPKAGAKLAALIEALAGATAWQPIETAPKDGTRFLAAHWAWGSEASGERLLALVHWDGEGWSTAYPGDPIDDKNHIYPPTHWQPLPFPPSGAIE